MDNRQTKKMNNLSCLVGNTPLLEIEFTYKEETRRIFAKAENLNMTGSIKDRMALHILRSAYEKGKLVPGATIIEATSGNTGIAFSAIGAALGHPVTIFMPDWMSDERKNLIRSLGAKVMLVSSQEGGFLGSIEKANKLAKDLGSAFLPRQFENNDNSMAHELTTGPEIYWQLKFNSITPDAFVAGVGTGGTIMGVTKALRAKYPKMKAHPLEPSNSRP
jgi:cysteine synthase